MLTDSTSRSVLWNAKSGSINFRIERMNMKKTGYFLALSALAVAISGCLTNVPKGEQSAPYRDRMGHLEEMKRQSEVDQQNRRVTIQNGPLMTGKKIPINRSPWLTEKRISMKVSSPVSGMQVMRMLMSQGLNMTSTMPLDSFTYAGYGFTSVDAETAMRLIFPAMGLDYVVDNDRRIITIVPMRPRQWTLNVAANRATNFESSSMSGTLDVGSELAASLSAASGGANGGGGMMGGGTPTSGSGEGSTATQGQSKVESKSDFWKSMRDELEARVNVLVPVSAAGNVIPTTISTAAGMPINGMPALPMGGIPQPAPAAVGSADMYRKQALGVVSVNPDTGTITVQAPTWLQDEIDTYIKGVEREFNTSIHFEGRLILVSTTKDKSEGLDLTAFASFANGELGMIINNNPAGGITISQPLNNLVPGNPPVMIPGGNVLGSTGLGFSKLTGNPANLFINYLEEMGDVSVMQRPAITTTSGSPAEFRRIETDLFSQISQSSVAGTEAASVATTNTQIPIRFGTLLRVNPKIDLDTGLVRTQLTLNVSVPSKLKTIDQYLTGPDGVTKVPTEITLPANIDYNGEALLRDGDTIIIGGQTEESTTNSGSGLTGFAKTGPLAGLLGSTSKSDKVSTYYFVLTAKVYDREKQPGAN